MDSLELPSLCYTKIPFPQLDYEITLNPLFEHIDKQINKQFDDKQKDEKVQKIIIVETEKIKNKTKNMKWIKIGNGSFNMRFNSHKECAEYLNCNLYNLSLAKRNKNKLIYNTLWWIIDFE